MRPLPTPDLQFKPQNQRTDAEQNSLIRQKLGLKDDSSTDASDLGGALNLDTIRHALRIAPDATPADINTALRGILAIGQGQSLASVIPDTSGFLDADLLRQVMQNPEATADEINGFFDRLAQQTNPIGTLTTLSASAPSSDLQSADLRFKTASSRTTDEDAEIIRQRLGISREAWNNSNA